MKVKFTKSGALPQGVHWATWDELERRFGTNIHRINLLAGLKKGLKILYDFGCREIYIGGSFVTDEPKPGDVDVCFDNSYMKWKLFEKHTLNLQ